MDNNDKRENTRDVKRAKRGIIIFFIAVALALAVMLILTEFITGEGSDARKDEAITVAPEKLYETKEEDFDIFEYDEYLKYDNSIHYDDGRSGVVVSVDDKTYMQYGEGFALVYEMINAIMRGDSEAYNQIVSEEAGHYDSFTQQQLYDITVIRQSEETVSKKGATYNEYIFIVEYKIHENNGSFRRDIESDASRPQYVVVDDSSGELLVTNIVFVKYAG